MIYNLKFNEQKIGGQREIIGGIFNAGSFVALKVFTRD